MPPPIPPPVPPPPIPPPDVSDDIVPDLPTTTPALPLGLVDRVAKLSLEELKTVIDGAGVDRSAAIEKDDLRELALQAASAGAAVPDVSDAVAAEAAAADEKRELTEHWSEAALRIQLELLAKPAPAGASKADLVDLYWAHLTAVGAAFGPEVDRRWLQVGSLDKDSQALRFVSAVTGVALPTGPSLQDVLKPGILLCDLASVFLRASGQAALKPSRVEADGNEGQAALSRLKAKQIENLSLYQAACLALGVAHSNTFNPDDLYEAKNLPSVVKNIHALAQV